MMKRINRSFSRNKTTNNPSLMNPPMLSLKKSLITLLELKSFKPLHSNLKVVTVWVLSVSSSMILEPILRLRKSMQTMNMPKLKPNAKMILKAMLREFLLQSMKLKILNLRLSVLLKLLRSTPLKLRSRSTRLKNFKKRTLLSERPEFKITLITLPELPK